MRNVLSWPKSPSLALPPRTGRGDRSASTTAAAWMTDGRSDHGKAHGTRSVGLWCDRWGGGFEDRVGRTRLFVREGSYFLPLGSRFWSRSCLVTVDSTPLVG